MASTNIHKDREVGETALSWAEAALTIAEETSKLLSNVPYLGPVAEVAKDIIQIVKEMKSAKEDCKSLSLRVVQKTNEIARKANKLDTSGIGGDFKEAIAAYQTALSDVKAFVSAYAVRGPASRLMTRDKDNKKIEQLNTDLDRTSSTFIEHVGIELALQVRAVEVQVGAVAVEIRNTEKQKRMEDVCTWLSTYSPRAVHNAAVGKRLDGTGDWFMKGTVYSDWKAGAKPVLWLNGIPGCGKTVLCSSVIQDVEAFCSTSPNTAFAYFYFDFKNASLGAKEGEERQLHDKMLRSMLKQLLTQLETAPLPATIARLFSDAEHRRELPTTGVLETAFKDVLGGFSRAFIIVDSLDECPVSEREDLLALLCRLIDWQLGNVSILCTSRKEADIEADLFSKMSSPFQEICLAAEDINADICHLIRTRLSQSPRAVWKKWPDTEQQKLQSTLETSSRGMFLLAFHQLNTLQRCLTTKQVWTAVKSLPKDLNSMYYHILSKIEEEQRTVALKIFQCLVFSACPMTLEEIAEVAALDLDTWESGPPVDPEQRWEDQHLSLHTICSSLVTTSKSPETGQDIVGLSHASVKDYFLKNSSPNSWYYFDELSANTLLCQVCLAYLLQFEALDCLDDETLSNVPLANYAAKYWATHAKKLATRTPDGVQLLIMKFLQDQSPPYINSFKLHDPDDPWHAPFEEEPPYVSPLYFASLAGLETAVGMLLLGEETDINSEGGQYGTALQAASAEGHQDVVKLLLAKDADVNADCGQWGTALQVASAQGHVDIVKLLLANDADVNTEGGPHGTALQAASGEGHLDIVKLLLAEDADINAESEQYGTALQAASAAGHLDIVKLLLAKDADINAKSGQHGTALQAASAGHLDIVELLLANKADINAEGGQYGTALQIASGEGHLDIVKLLLAKDADVNTKGGRHGTALQAASGEGHLDIVKLLLAKDADVNSKGGWYGYGTALQAASAEGHVDIVQVLLAKDPDVNAEGERYGTALQAASVKGHLDIVKLLLAKGANINAKGGQYGTALQAASAEGHMAIVELLSADLQKHE